MRIVLLGPPGSGKGTQAKLIVNACHAPHISTGDILRDAVSRGTSLGQKAKGYMDEGKLVPDDLMVSLVEDRLKQKDCEHGFILDGFPRTVEQAGELDHCLIELEIALDMVLSIEVDSAKVIERLSNRRLCKDCGCDFNLSTNPPRQEGRCDACGGELYQRQDDNAETIGRRLEVYAEQTSPVKEHYEKSGLLRGIQGDGEVKEVFAEIASHLNCEGI